MIFETLTTLIYTQYRKNVLVSSNNNDNMRKKNWPNQKQYFYKLNFEIGNKTKKNE